MKTLLAITIYVNFQKIAVLVLIILAVLWLRWKFKKL